MTDIKRTRLDDAFAQTPKIVRKSYVTLADVTSLQERPRSKESRLIVVERCNKYCAVADRPRVKRSAHRIGAALRKEHGADEGTRCLNTARDYRAIIPRELWATRWQEVPAGARVCHRSTGADHLPELPVPTPHNKPPAVVPPRLDRIVAGAIIDERDKDINRQLYEVRANLGKLDRQMENRATPSEIRGLINKFFNDSDVSFGEKVYKLNSRLGHLEESRPAFTDGWKDEIAQIRGCVTKLQDASTADAGQIARIDSQMEDDRVNFQHMSEEFNEYTRSTPYGLLATLEAKSHRHAHRRLPNPLRPIAALASRVRLAVRVLMRGQEHPFQ